MGFAVANYVYLIQCLIFVIPVDVVSVDPHGRAMLLVHRVMRDNIEQSPNNGQTPHIVTKRYQWCYQ